MKNLTSFFILAIMAVVSPLVAVAQSSGADHIIEVNNNFFDPGNLTVQLGETVRWVNGGGIHNVNGSFDAYPDNPEHFFSGTPEGGNWEFEHTFNSVGEYTYHCDSHHAIGMTGNITVVENQSYLLVNMSDLREIDADGIPVLNGQLVEVLGTVYGTNLRPNGLQFTIIDGNNKGVGIFNTTGNLGYVVEEANLIRVWGQVSFFNGLTQIEPDSIDLVSTDNPLVDPLVVTEFNESIESSLIMLEEVEVTNPEDWPNIFVENAHGTFLMRIQREVNLGSNPPEGTFDLIGIGGQFTTIIPADDGYQIIPRYIEDLGIDPGDDEYLQVTIPEVREVDADFIPLLLGEKVEVSAVVYGTNLRPQGLQFTIIDSDNVGVSIFNASGNLGYEVNEGDLILVRGTVEQFNGLAQIAPDEIELISEDNPLVDPMVVTELNEETESALIMLEDVIITNPEDWPSPGQAANIFVENIHGTFLMRIQRDVNLGNTPPDEAFDLIGIGGQFTTNIPADDGYQIIPRYIDDIGGETGSPYLPVSMTDLRENDLDGKPVLLGEQVEATAVVYGINYRPAGLQFTIIDENNVGVGVFRASGNLGYEVVEGDLITVRGTVAEFRGLTQINAEEIDFIESDQPLVEPRVVNVLDESTESSLIRIEGVSLVDATQWVEEGAEGNVMLERNGDGFVLRIQRESRLGNEAPEGLLNITGIGTQFTTAVPANDGYQIIPRYAEDIEMVSSTIGLASGIKVSVWPNPVADLLHIESEATVYKVILFDLSGKMILQQENLGGIESLDISKEKPGQYLLMIKTETGSGVVPVILYN